MNITHQEKYSFRLKKKNQQQEQTLLKMKKHPYIARHIERLSTEQGFRKRSPHPTPPHPWKVEGFKVFLVP